MRKTSDCIDCSKKTSSKKSKRCRACYQKLRYKNKKINYCIDCQGIITRNAKRCKPCNNKNDTGRHLSKETIEKIRKCNKNKKISEEHKEKLRIFHTNRPMSDESKAKISLFFKGRKRKPFSKEHKKNMSLAKKGNKNPMFKIRGEKHHNWKNGATLLKRLIRQLLEYKNWRTVVFQRDEYSCKFCYQKGERLYVHHKKAFAIILQEFLKEFNQFSPTEDRETLIRLAMTYRPFWDINNGVTLCKKCHIEITKEQRALIRKNNS